MSRENAELAREAFEAINRRDLPALLMLIDDEVWWRVCSGETKALEAARLRA
jgi:ketosteroid isomerase-like protein